ncbi:neprosin family prolyl endopeptidase [Paraherbaspirillum soli]|uniref:Neprosin family prolyl endopeptidase n=1 Tax=Paraherbaspirillum soli TaxID=631222 RepID=A0ABW0M364_9BURK
MTHTKNLIRFAAAISMTALSTVADYSLAADTDASASATTAASSQNGNRGDDKLPFLSAQAVRVQSAGELARMQKYLDERIDRAAIHKSLINAKGRKVDCVDINAQPALKNKLLQGHKVELSPRSAPAQAPAAATHNMIEPLFEIEAATGAAAAAQTGACPAGSVPIPEVTSEDLHRFSSLDDFFAKYPAGAARRATPIIPPFHNGPTSQHQYAHAYRYVTNWGAQSTINVWATYTELNSEFSLGQIWVVAGSGGGLQTLEVGTQKYHDLYNDDNPHLFIYSTRGGYAPGTGCYNNTCGDFVQVSSSIYPGAVLSPVSVFNGAQYEASMQWFKDMDGGAWWLNFQGQWVGYYPRALYNAGGVQDHAAEIDFGGEIIDNRNLNLHTSTDMGSGSFPSAWFQKAAYMKKLNYNYTTTTNPNTVWNTEATGLTTSRSDSACYDIAYYSGDANWGSYFFYGGPGYDYNNCR